MTPTKTAMPRSAGKHSRNTRKATELLKLQHREIKRLFKGVEGTEHGGKRRELLDRIEEVLKVHTAIEEMIFYPAVRTIGTSKAEEKVLESLEEHHVVDLIVAELPRLDPEDERFSAKMTVLSELVAHHADEEEKEMFPMAERRLGAERLSELGQQMASSMEEQGREYGRGVISRGN